MDPFDNYHGCMDGNLNIAEACSGSVYCNYLQQCPNNPNEFVFDLIINADRTNIDKAGWHTCCPLLFTSSLSTEKARCNHLFWCQIEYMFDMKNHSSAENVVSSCGHGAKNNHKQLAVVFEGLRKIQEGDDL